MQHVVAAVHEDRQMLFNLGTTAGGGDESYLGGVNWIREKGGGSVREVQ